MKIFVAAVALVSTFLALPAPPGSAQEVLTNQSIVEMVRAGLSERIIVAKIQSSQTNFDTRTEALIASLELRGPAGAEREAALAALMPEKAVPDTSKLLLCPMPGLVKAIHVAAGQEVKTGEPLCVVEAMKMENPIVAHRDGVVSQLDVVVGQQVTSGQLICVLHPSTE